MNINKPLPKTPQKQKEETQNKLTEKETPQHRNQGVKDAYNKLTENSKHPPQDRKQRIQDAYDKLNANSNQTPQHRNKGVEAAYNKLNANSNQTPQHNKQTPRRKNQPRHQITSRHTIP